MTSHASDRLPTDVHELMALLVELGGIADPELLSQQVATRQQRTGAEPSGRPHLLNAESTLLDSVGDTIAATQEQKSYMDLEYGEEGGIFIERPIGNLDLQLL